MYNFFIYILLIYLLINKKYTNTQELPPEAELTAEKVSTEPANHKKPKYGSAIPTQPQDRLAKQPND